ncbi:hypothetical protein CVS40_7706 [Lucilia cuprina]|nr:hypothetical protein CVS40_7706 [Lucilia cuprina]
MQLMFGVWAYFLSQVLYEFYEAVLAYRKKIRMDQNNNQAAAKQQQHSQTNNNLQAIKQCLRQTSFQRACSGNLNHSSSS